MGKNTLTQKRLKEVIDYNPETGIFKWIKNHNKIKSGSVAGSKSTQGYILIYVDMKSYLSHRLAFLYMDGYFPEGDVDHINRIRHDNRWCNLREVSRRCNSINSSISKNNTSGVTGVICAKNYKKKWLAQISTGGKCIRLGSYDNFSDAVMARWIGEVEYNFPNCNTTSSSYLYLKENNMIDDNYYHGEE